MNKNQESLKNFYGYKETFAKAAQWVPVSKDLTWIHTSNPYEDNDDDERELQRAREPVTDHHSREPSGNTLSQADYATFTEGLAALSAVASQDQFAQPPVQAQEMAMQNSSTTTSNQQLEYILNPSSRLSTTDHQLDPQLQMLDSRPSHSPTYVRAQASPARDNQP